LFDPRREGTRYRTLGIVYVAILGALLVMHGRVYYLAPAYPMLFAAGGGGGRRGGEAALARPRVDPSGLRGAPGCRRDPLCPDGDALSAARAVCALLEGPRHAAAGDRNSS